MKLRRDENDGGSAFPIPGPFGAEARGMSLRDWFAGQALAAMLPKLTTAKEWDEADARIVEYAPSIAYELADEMLKAREK